MGKFDPTTTIETHRYTKVHGDGRGSVVRQDLAHADGTLTISLSGETSVDYLAAWQSRFPLDDGLDTFLPEHPTVRRIATAFPRLRILRMPWLWDTAVGCVLQQRVDFGTAASQFGRILARWGTQQALGVALPDAARVAAIPQYELESMGIDPRRARALLQLAREERFKSFLHEGTDLPMLRKRLLATAGIGAWTTEMILGFGGGDTDAVPVGDSNLPQLVCSALAGESRASDARMLELLEPFRGQRFRVIRLLWAAAGQAPHLIGQGPRRW